MRQADCTANSEKPLVASVIFGADRDQRATAQTARDLEVPNAPTGIGRDKIFVRHQKIGQSGQQHLLLGSGSAPVRELEGARFPADASALLGVDEAYLRLGSHLLCAPFDALPATQQRTEINQQ